MGRTASRALGQRAEQVAFEHLLGHGLTPVTRNFRSRGGEIDLIMMDEQCLVFVEVRCRSSNRFAEASHTVDTHKQRKLIRTAALFVARNRRFGTSTMRFDVIAVAGDGDMTIEWIPDAFRPGDSSL